MTVKQFAWTGLVPVDDTALAVTDTGGPGLPVVYLNGSYASQSHWRRVITALGDGYRHITYDERARGRSRRSEDYSFEGCVRDVDAVLEARDVGQADPRRLVGRRGDRDALGRPQPRPHRRRGVRGRRRPLRHHR